MSKIIHRPEPPIEMPSASHGVQNTSLVQNREVSARLFEQALIKAEGQRRSEFKTHERSADRQIQVNKTVTYSKAVDSEQVRQSVLTASRLELSGEEFESTQTESTPEDDTESNVLVDEDEGALDSSALFFTPSPVPTAGVSPFSAPIDQALVNRDGNGPLGLSVEDAATGQPDTIPFDSSGEQCSHLTGLSELDQFIEASDGMAGLKDWSFTFDDDGPIEELTLSFKEDSGWNIRVLAAAQDAEYIDNQLLENLYHRLQSAGLAVGAVGFIEVVPEDQ